MKTARDVAVGTLGSLLAAALVYLAAGKAPLAGAVVALALAAGAATLWLLERRRRLASVPFAAHIRHSDYEFGRIIETANRSIFAVGPNLNYMVSAPGFKEQLFNKLARPGFRVWILVSDPEATQACKVWADVSFTGDFDRALKTTLRALGEWMNEARSKAPQFDLVAKKTGLITLALLFLDADDPKSARVVVTPVPWRVPGGRRPAFLLKRSEHPSAFDLYYSTYDQLFRNQAQDITAVGVAKH